MHLDIIIFKYLDWKQDKNKKMYFFCSVDFPLRNIYLFIFFPQEDTILLCTYSYCSNQVLFFIFH